MIQLALSLLGSILIAPIAIPVGLAILSVSLLCFCITAVVVGCACGWAIAKACLWSLVNRIIDWLPFLLDRERETIHESVNVFFDYCHTAHNPTKAASRTTPTTPLNTNLPRGMTSQEWLARKDSLGSLTTYSVVDFENTDGYLNGDDDTEELWMAQRRGSILQPGFNSPPRSRRQSKAGSPDVSRPPSRAPTPSAYNAFTESMRPPSRSGSGFFGTSPVTPFRGNPATPGMDQQYFQLPQVTSPISLQGRRPSLSSIIHRRNNQSTTSFGSVPEEMTGTNEERRND